MRQTIELDDRVANQLKKLTGETTARQALLKAVQEFISQRQRLGVLRFFGSGKIQFRYTNSKLEQLEGRG